MVMIRTLRASPIHWSLVYGVALPSSKTSGLRLNKHGSIPSSATGLLCDHRQVTLPLV